jgi:hypothetical protein
MLTFNGGMGEEEGFLPSLTMTAIVSLVITTVQLSFPLLLAIDRQRALGAIDLARDAAVVVFAHDALDPTTLAALTGHRRVPVQWRRVGVGRVEAAAKAASPVRINMDASLAALCETRGLGGNGNGSRPRDGTGRGHGVSKWREMRAKIE